MSSSLVERLQADLVTAMKARDDKRVEALRLALAAIGNAGAVEGRQGPTTGLFSAEAPRLELSDTDHEAIVAHERDELLSTAVELRGHRRDVEADELEATAKHLALYLG